MIEPWLLQCSVIPIFLRYLQELIIPQFIPLTPFCFDIILDIIIKSILTFLQWIFFPFKVKYIYYLHILRNAHYKTFITPVIESRFQVVRLIQHLHLPSGKNRCITPINNVKCIKLFAVSTRYGIYREAIVILWHDEFRSDTPKSIESSWSFQLL